TQDVKTYPPTAPVPATLRFGSLAGLSIETNRFFPDAPVSPPARRRILIIPSPRVVR
uniref:Photosystem I reaction center subunit IX n=1 Tax=Selaginella tamariscina TaxID=137178 RepID=A0A6C0UDT8_9TRAC|nr:photosystem I subunit IX [Selaginella tamariscina]